MRLQDKVAVVTGGASGFGAGIVRKFAEEGARVVVADLNVNGAHEIAAEVKGLAIHVDVADGASWLRWWTRRLVPMAVWTSW
jgi:3-oxoacyl-[acyl-carrier protein] reductase